MKLSQALIVKLTTRYEPSAMVEMKFNGKDVLFKTDGMGNPVVLFIGKASANGRIKGNRYVRTLRHDAKGLLIKDHWDLKGMAD